MSQQLHPDIDKFYLSVLGYAGMKYEDGVITNISDKIGNISIDGKPLTLPYYDNLKKPEGRHIFHPLNENFSAPETAFLSMYKKALVLNLNLKLSALMISLMSVCADVGLQQKVKSGKLIALISSIGETDMTTVTNFAGICKYAQKTNEEAFIFDVFLKKNAEIDDVPYAATGKLNFLLYNELRRSLEEKEGNDYKVFGYKVRKKDVVTVLSVFDALFGLEGATENTYTVGTDHRPFRYFNALLLTTYQVASKINEVAKLLEGLKQPLLGAEEMAVDTEWCGCIEEVYNLTEQIRMIPSQTNASVEANVVKANRLNIREPVSLPRVDTPTMSSPTIPKAPPSFIPQQPQPQQLVQQHQPQQVEMSAEDIIRGAMNGMVGGGMMQPQGMMQPMQMMAPNGQMVYVDPRYMMGTPQQQQPMMGGGMQAPQGMIPPQQFGQFQQPMQMPQQPMLQPYQQQPFFGVQSPQLQPQQQMGGIPLVPFLS